MFRSGSSVGFSVRASLTLAVLIAGACHHRQPEASNVDVGASGEPFEYSATIIQTIEDGSDHSPTVTREMRSGDKRREDWTEDGHNRGLIWRPDLGKAFRLDLDQRLFVELDLTQAANETNNETNKDNSREHDEAKNDSSDALVQMVDRAIDDSPMPDEVQTRLLRTETIDGYTCRVYERRSSLPDGHIEIVRTFRASDLAGLALKIETESEPATSKVITLRTEVRLDVSPDAFIVPPDFKKVEKLGQ
jgi:hypothetical protein